jgi:hypothetical protein
MRTPRRALRTPRGVPVFLGLLLTLASCVGAASADASTYVGEQVGPAHGVVVLTVSARRVTARQVAVDCAGSGSTLAGHGSGQISAGRFSFKISYVYYVAGRAASAGSSAKGVRQWATLTGAIHGARITGELATVKSGSCTGARFRATRGSRGRTSGTVTNGSVTSNGSEEATAGGEVSGGEPATAPGLPFPEEGNYEAAFNQAWETAVEGLCHASGSSSAAQAQAAAVESCSSIVSPEGLALSQS